MSVTNFLGGHTGIFYPSPLGVGQFNLTLSARSGTLDASGEALHMVGYLFIDGRPSGSKTISAAGGGSITWLGYTNTFSNASTNLRVGLQDVDTAASTDDAHGDGTFDVYADLVGGTDTLTSNSWYTHAMESGTKSLSHGDLIAVVLEMTARGGTDVVRPGIVDNQAMQWPVATQEAPDGTYAFANGAALAIITFDDGTLGWFYGQSNTLWTILSQYDVNSTPDEYAQLFTVPRPVYADGIWSYFGMVEDAASGTTELILYSDALGTPAAVTGGTITLDHSLKRTTSGGLHLCPFAQPILLVPGVTYAVSIRPTTADNVQPWYASVGNNAHWVVFGGGTDAIYGTRTGQSGAFSTTDTRRLTCGVIIGGDLGIGGGAAHQLGI